MTMLMHESLQSLETLDLAEGAERRRGLRVMQNRPVKVLDSLSGKYFGGQTQDVSSMGLRIELPAHATLQGGERLTIYVGLSTAGQSLANRRHMIPVKVVWVSRPSARRKTMMAGLEFASSIGAQLHAA